MLKAGALAIALSAVLSAQQPSYTPPHLVRGDLPSLPPPTVVGGGEVLIEATVDQTGALTRPVVLRTTPPYTNIVLDAVTRWRFTPAQINTNGKEAFVNGSVLIAAIYRPPTLMNGPTLGDRPRDLSTASSSSPYPVSTGQVANIRGVGADPGFDAAAKDAIIQWKFRGASFDGHSVPSTAYVIFGFAPPVVGAPINAAPGTSPIPPPAPQLPLPPGN